jgi:hypothetical protein
MGSIILALGETSLPFMPKRMEASDSIERMSFLLRTNSFADADSSIEKTPIGDRMHVVRLDF